MLDGDQKRRLLVLADFLETKVPPERFDLSLWVNKPTVWEDPDLSCGTIACAAGWATAIPELRAEGFHLVEGLIPKWKNYSPGGTSIELFFGADAWDLFFVVSYPIGQRSPKHVAARMRALVEAHS